MLVGAALVSSRRRELMEVMGLRSQRPGLALVLDTSALIDGRIGEFVGLPYPMRSFSSRKKSCGTSSGWLNTATLPDERVAGAASSFAALA
jgi:hypothetical protein